MKTVRIGEFTREFSRHRKEACVVQDRGRVIGTWTPMPANADHINFEERAKKDFTEKLPFTFADLLRQAKKQ